VQLNQKELKALGTNFYQLSPGVNHLVLKMIVYIRSALYTFQDETLRPCPWSKIKIHVLQIVLFDSPSHFEWISSTG